MTTARAMEGADNLIDHCLGKVNGMTVGLVAERPELGWYDAAIADVLDQRITEKGGRCYRLASNGPANETDPLITTLEEQVDALIFLCRSGDQGRFERKAETKPVVVCYARNLEMLASPFGTLPHDAMIRLKKEIDHLSIASNEIEITCPNGTFLTGSITSPPQQEGDQEVGIKRFPMSVPQPLSCEGFMGRVVIKGHLAPTGSRVYTPAIAALEDAVTVTLDGHTITALEGSEKDMATFRHHYHRVARQFGLEPFFVHSFHAGIHPGLNPATVSDKDADYWANTVFGSPRFLHFHTCGMTPPGEICWMIAEPTISLDGDALWQHGVLQPLAFDRLRSVLQETEIMQSVFASQQHLV